MKRKVTNKDIKKAIRGVINEGHGSYMAKSQLYNIARKAQSMYDQLEKGEPLEDWMESNIAKMDNMMDSVSDSFSYDQHQERSCPDGMYWCGKDQICKPDSQDMSVIVSTQEMMNESKILKEWSALARVFSKLGVGVEKKILSTAVKQIEKNAHRGLISDLENTISTIMSKNSDKAFNLVNNLTRVGKEKLEKEGVRNVLFGGKNRSEVVDVIVKTNKAFQKEAAVDGDIIKNLLTNTEAEQIRKAFKAAGEGKITKQNIGTYTKNFPENIQNMEITANGNFFGEGKGLFTSRMNTDSHVIKFKEPMEDLLLKVSQGKIGTMKNINPMTGRPYTTSSSHINPLTDEPFNPTYTIKEDYEMSDTYSRSSYKPTPRETQLSGAFGKYGEDIPPAVIRYIRKNPRLVLKNLADIYGDKIYDYIPPKVEEEINEAIGFTKSYEGELDGHIDDFIDVVCGFISEQVKEKSLYGDEIVVQRLYQLLTDGGELHSPVQELVDILDSLPYKEEGPVGFKMRQNY